LRLAAVVAALLAIAGCKGISTPAERQARQDLQSVREAYRPDSQPRPLPVLTTHSSLEEFLRFAMLNQPRVEAAYFDWAASVERITRERSLPDPRLTFETDIQDAVMSLMPGLMLNFPGFVKLRQRADVAWAESQAKYAMFETAALQTAFELKRAYYRLYFLDEKIRVTRAR
jgi:outer membrane protein TolC